MYRRAQDELQSRAREWIQRRSPSTRPQTEKFRPSGCVVTNGTSAGQATPSNFAARSRFMTEQERAWSHGPSSDHRNPNRFRPRRKRHWKYDCALKETGRFPAYTGNGRHY